MKSKIKYLIVCWLTISLSVGILIICAAMLVINFTVFLWMFFVFYILSLISAVVILNNRRNGDAKISWLVAIFGIPVLGIMFYFLFGKGFPKKAYKKSLNEINASNNASFWKQHNKLVNSDNIQDSEAIILKNLSKLLNTPFTSNDSLKILNSGPISYEEMFLEIEKAKEYIFISYFIISDGVVLDAFFELLKKKVSEKVKVYFLYDPIGSFFTVSSKYIEKFKKIGVKISDFTIKSAFGKWSFLNYRYHRKLILIDGEVAMFGGINIGNEYANLTSEYGYWHDNFIKVTGNSVCYFQNIFVRDWEHVTKEVIKCKEKNKLILDSDLFVQVIDIGPYYENSPSYITICNLISSSKKRIYITTPYLIVPDSIVTLLQNAVSRGVDVKIITPSYPDKKNIFELTRWTYLKLIPYGVKIYELQNTFLHSKIGIFDNNFSLLGSVNLDNRSLFQNFELCGLVFSQKVNEQCTKFFNNSLKSSKEIHSLPKYKWYKKVKIAFLNIMSPLF